MQPATAETVNAEFQHDIIGDRTRQIAGLVDKFRALEIDGLRDPPPKRVVVVVRDRRAVGVADQTVLAVVAVGLDGAGGLRGPGRAVPPGGSGMPPSTAGTPSSTWISRFSAT